MLGIVLTRGNVDIVMVGSLFGQTLLSPDLMLSSEVAVYIPPDEQAAEKDAS